MGARLQQDAPERRAEGAATAKVLEAEAEALAIQMQGQALRENPDVLQLRAIENWDGVLPRFLMGGQTIPFIQIPANMTG